jgi:hypothetical protein
MDGKDGQRQIGCRTGLNGRDLVENPRHLAARVSGARDLAAHDYVIGSIAQGFGWSGDTLLIAGRTSGGAHARRDQERRRAGDLAVAPGGDIPDASGIERRSHDAIHARLDGTADA